MKTFKFLFFSGIFIILLFTCNDTFSQNVGINQTGNPPDTSAMLDVASTTKGFLAPRMTTAQRTAIYSPAIGLLVYDTDLSGFYYFGSTGWVKMESASNLRSNYVLVKSASDFPTPVSGIINLAANTTYEVNGTITLTNMINLDDAKIIGLDRVNDLLLYTGASQLFTGSYGGYIQGVSLSATTSGAEVFNLNNTTATDQLNIDECNIINSDKVGLVQGFLELNMFDVEYSANNYGITYQNITNMILSNIMWKDNNKGTNEKFAGTFNAIHKSGGYNDVLAANSATAIDVTGITSITDKASLSGVVFIGDGIYVNGAFSNQWFVHSFGIPEESDEIATGNYYISTSASTAIASVNTPVKVAGTTTPVNLYRVASPANNRLVYTGTRTRYFRASCSLTAFAASNNQVFSFYITKNGVILPESTQTFKLTNNTDQNSLNVSCNVKLATNDYIEVWVSNNTSASNVTVATLNLAIN